MKNNILLVDGMALLFRGFYATAYRENYMFTKSGVPTNGVYQFLRYLFDAIDHFTPSHIVCCWDMGSKTFRTEVYPEYKSNRKEPPDELVPQFELVKEVTRTLSIPNIGLDNYEADDCIGTLSNQYAPFNHVTILTGDHDLLQLVNESIQVAIMKKGIGNYDVYTNDNFIDKKGIHPYQIVDYKALTGDSADNYPGVKGIGEKTAAKLLNEYKTIDQLLIHLDHLSPTIRKRIETHLEMLHISRRLAQIQCDVPITHPIDQTAWLIDKSYVKQTFIAMECDHFTKII